MSIYNMQPFFIAVYLNGSYSTYLVNPSSYQSTIFFKIRFLGRKDIDIYAKPDDNRIYIKTNSNTNGRLSLSFLYESSANILSIENGTTPSDFTKIEMSEM